MTIKRFSCDNPLHRDFDARSPSEEHKLYCPACRAAWEQAAMRYMIENGPGDMQVTEAVALVQTCWYNAVDEAIRFNDPMAEPAEYMSEEMACWEE